MRRLMSCLSRLTAIDTAYGGTLKLSTGTGLGRPPMDAPLLEWTPKERALVQRLSTPEKVQAWLSSLPYNWERRGETARTFRGVVRTGTAHCLEAALSAACILEQHGWPPLLIDIESADHLDHVLFVFRRGGRWGAVGRSRCLGLHGRRPVYASLRALAKSYSAPF